MYKEYFLTKIETSATKKPIRATFLGERTCISLKIYHEDESNLKTLENLAAF